MYLILWIFEMNKILAKNNKHLHSLIHQEMEKNGPNCDLNHIDVSNVTNMSYMFYNSPFNGDISKWDVSNVINMSDMFRKSQFNQDISNWDVSNLNNMSWMFYDSKFNQDISKWNVSNVNSVYAVFNSMFHGMGFSK